MLIKIKNYPSPFYPVALEAWENGKMILICSSPFIDKAAPRPEFFDYVFTVYSTPEKVREAMAAGAMECNGKKCRDCGYSCYNGTWPEGSNIAELLRK